MKTVREPRPELESLTPYDTKDLKVEVNLASNEHPHNLPSGIFDRLLDRLREFPFNRYPDPTAKGLRELIAEANGLSPSSVVIGNGGDEIIFNVLLAWGGPGRTLLDCPPTFSMYGIDARSTGTTLVTVPRLDDFSVDEEGVLERLAGDDIDIVILAHPNNPTGNLTPETTIIKILEATDALVLVDEAYFEFSRTTVRPLMSVHKNLAIIRTFSKAFSLAGLRVGYLLAHEDIACELLKVRQPYSVDSFSQWVARTVFRERRMFEQSLRDILHGRDELARGLALLDGVEVFPTEANFVMFRVEHAPALWRDLLQGHSVLVRDFSTTPGLEGCLRVTVGTPEENQRFLDAMADCLGQRRLSGVIGSAVDDEDDDEDMEY